MGLILVAQRIVTRPLRQVSEAALAVAELDGLLEDVPSPPRRSFQARAKADRT